MASQIRALLNKPEYWENTFAAGYVSTTYDESGKLPPRTQELVDKMRPRLGGKGARHPVLVGRAWATTASRSSSMR